MRTGFGLMLFWIGLILISIGVEMAAIDSGLAAMAFTGLLLGFLFVMVGSTHSTD